RRKMALKQELIDELLKDYQRPEDLIGESGLLKQLTKALVERALKSELTHHLGYEKGQEVTGGASNRRNGGSQKTLKGDFGELEITITRPFVSDLPDRRPKSECSHPAELSFFFA